MQHYIQIRPNAELVQIGPPRTAPQEGSIRAGRDPRYPLVTLISPHIMRARPGRSHPAPPLGRPWAGVRCTKEGATRARPKNATNITSIEPHSSVPAQGVERRVHSLRGVAGRGGAG